MVTGLREHGLDLKVGDDNPAARVLRAHGLDLETVRAGIDRLVAEGVLLGPQPSDAALLATLGIDLDAVMARLEESFGWEAYYYAAQNVRLRPAQPFPVPREPGHRSSAGECSCCPRGVPPAARTSPRALAARPARRAEDPVEVTAHRYPRWNAGSGPCSASPTMAPARSGCLSEPQAKLDQHCACARGTRPNPLTRGGSR